MKFLVTDTFHINAGTVLVIDEYSGLDTSITFNVKLSDSNGNEYLCSAQKEYIRKTSYPLHEKEAFLVKNLPTTLKEISCIEFVI